ncbi:MAG: TrkH family potassium uptake protein [Verrucomicrobiaceae bacterium]
MNIAILLRALGTMVLLLGVAMVICLGLSFVVPIDVGHNPSLDLVGWGSSLAITVAVGSSFYFGGRILVKRKKSAQVMRRREAMALVGIGWVVCSMIGAMPYLFCEPHLPFSSAIFESVSGLTTTGATIFMEIEGLPKSILLWRSVTQWVGGMGILAMFVVVLSGMGVSSKTLIGAESSMSNSDLASLRQTMRQLWVLYFGFTVVGGLGLFLLGLSPFQAVNHIMTAVSTGGFGTENDSAAGPEFTVWVKCWLIIVMTCGAISFPFYLSLIKRNTREFRQRYEEVWWYFGLLGAACLVLFGSQIASHFEAHPVDVVFNVVSMSTSTGYVSTDFEQWGDVTIGTILVLMIIGGCSGSTAGGLKVSRIVLWVRYVKGGLKQTFRPKVLIPIKMGGRPVTDSTLAQLLLVISLFGFFAITGAILFRILEHHHSALGTLSLIVSLLGNTGPAFAEMGPTESFGELSSASKVLCSGIMVLGRLEYVAVLILFSRALWKKY